MRRLLLVAAMALAVFTLPMKTAAQSTVEAAVADIDAFWTSEFASLGIAYSSPQLQAVDRPTDTPCGTLDPLLSPGAYCPANDTVYYSTAWAPDSASAEILWWTVLSHEWGHHIQSLIDTGVATVQDAELQADCFAGAYMQHARDTGLVSPEAVSQALSLTQEAGDVWFFLPADAPEHGTKTERAMAFMTGMNGGVTACGIGS